MKKTTVFLISSLLAACAVTPPAATEPVGGVDQTITLLLTGDVMLGRRVATVAEAEGPGLFESVRYVISSADLAAANLESPLTERAHISDNPNALEADPGTARLLAGAGFDLMSLANNHSGDAGPEGVIDTIRALEAASLVPLGAGSSRVEATDPVVLEAGGIEVAFLAFDTTGQGIEATDEMPGVARYSLESARHGVERAAAESDVVVVSLHGGIEYLPEPDPVLEDIAEDLVARGADVVWGHGAHVPQPVKVEPTPTGGNAVIATSLGNLLFDQQRPITQKGLLLVVLVSSSGVQAYRLGWANHDDLRVRFDGWSPPAGNAVLLDQEWWSLPGDPLLTTSETVKPADFELGDVTTAASGDVTGNGELDLVASYRHPFEPNEINTLFPDHDFADVNGQSAHLGVFDPQTLAPRWAAGTLMRPVARIQVCQGDMALAFDSLDDPETVATGAWTWWDFGFVTAPELPGPGRPACADIDLDGDLDPLVLGRS